MGKRHTDAVKYMYKEHAPRVLMCFTHAVSAHRYERLLAIYIVTSVILRFRDYLNVVYFYVLLSNWEYAEQAWLKQLKIIKFRWVLGKKKNHQNRHITCFTTDDTQPQERKQWTALESIISEEISSQLCPLVLVI